MLCMETRLTLSSIGSDSGFYQNAFGQAFGCWNEPRVLSCLPSLLNDSFVTIGLDTSVGNEMLNIGIDWTSFEAGGAIATDNGSWFGTPAMAQVYEVGGKVLIGQFTVAEGDHVFGTLNLQGKNSDSSNWYANVWYRF